MSGGNPFNELTDLIDHGIKHFLSIDIRRDQNRSRDSWNRPVLESYCTESRVLEPPLEKNPLRATILLTEREPDR